jgi:5-methylcytosine-specific restriction endonuclease McrA
MTGTGRNLTTTREQVFGDVKVGTECRICGRNVTDGRSKTCSDYCGNLLEAVMGMLNWSPIRRQIIDRDDETCQHCGWSLRRERCAREHIRGRIEELAGERPEPPGLSERDEWDEFDWDDYHEHAEAWRECRERMQARYGDPYKRARDLEVDHIERVADGGHPFDPANLQTLCSECHQDKTARENREQGQTPSRGDLSESLFEYVSGGAPAEIENS